MQMIVCKVIKAKREELITTGKQNYFAHVMHFKLQICVCKKPSLCPIYNGMSAYK